jgi:hypothetical protein
MNRTLGTLVASGALLAGGVALAPAASANNCPSGNACIWQDPNFVTNGNANAYVKDALYIPVYGSWNYAGTASNAGDSASSVTNVGNFETATFWISPNCPVGTGNFSLVIQSGDGDLTNSTGQAPGGFDNKLSSTAFSSYVSSCR